MNSNTPLGITSLELHKENGKRNIFRYSFALIWLFKVLFKLNLLYHIWSIFSHFPPGSDALFTEGVITVGQDPKDIISWRLLFINIVHADSTGYRHVFPGAWGSSRTIVLFFSITGNRLLDTFFFPFNYLPKIKKTHFLVNVSNTWDTSEFCSNCKGGV